MLCTTLEDKPYLDSSGNRGTEEEPSGFVSMDTVGSQHLHPGELDQGWYVIAACDHFPKPNLETKIPVLWHLPSLKQALILRKPRADADGGTRHERDLSHASAAHWNAHVGSRKWFLLDLRMPLMLHSECLQKFNI